MIGTSQVGAPPMVIQPSGILMPIFSVRKVNTSVTIFDGCDGHHRWAYERRGQNGERQDSRFGEYSSVGSPFSIFRRKLPKRNLLIFVSASIVSRGGSPVREVIQNISPQSIFKDPVIMTPTGTIRRVFKGAGQPAVTTKLNVRMFGTPMNRTSPISGEVSIRENLAYVWVCEKAT